MTEIRELEVGYPTAHDPNFSAKQYFEFQTAMSPNQKYVLQGIDKLLIDGMNRGLYVLPGKMERKRISGRS